MGIQKVDGLVGADGKPLKTDDDRLPKVLIGIPCGMQTFVAFEDSMQQAIRGVGTYFEGVINRAMGYITADARNQLAKQALEGDFDYLFFMDSDMIFPAGTLVKMLRRTAEIPEPELPVLSGIYNTRSDHRLNVYKWLEGKHTYQSVDGKQDSDFHLGADELYVADGCGTGCMLIDMAVFEEIEWPWFTYEYWQGPSGKREWWSEDLVFCKRLYDKGIHVYFDNKIVCKHILPSVVYQVSDDEYQVERISGEVY